MATINCGDVELHTSCNNGELSIELINNGNSEQKVELVVPEETETEEEPPEEGHKKIHFRLP